MHGPTPSQTVGPYFTMRLSGEGDNVLTTPGLVGERIRIEGRVLDGDRKHIEDALIELWQANAAGRYHHPADDRDDVPLDPAFNGFGRCASDFKTGAYSFLTIKPGPVPHPNGGMQAPHIWLTIRLAACSTRRSPACTSTTRPLRTRPIRCCILCPTRGVGR